jgi:hypothetical protein
MFEEVLNVQVASISQTEPDFKIIVFLYTHYGSITFIGSSA